MSADNSRRPSNEELVETLTRLADMLKHDANANQEPPQLSHYGDIPHAISTAYELLNQGAQLIHSTATKYTLVGKIDETEQKKLGADLLRGCELVAAAANSLLQDVTGCSRAVRRATQRAALAIILNVIHLAASFSDHTALEENIGAQKTGAVWQSCDAILNNMLPMGNRNAMRRELLTWTRETNDSMEEFNEMVDRGPGEATENDEEDELDGIFGDDDDQYSEDELPVAKACLGMLKCSRGMMKLTLQASEDFGKKYSETQDEKYLDQIAQLHAKARVVGEGVTNMGSSMYPPILPNSKKLEEHVKTQSDAIESLLELAMGLDGLSPNISELAHILHVAIGTRREEFKAAMSKVA